MMFREPENRGLHFKLFGYLMDMEEQHPFHNLADLYVSALGEGEAEFEVPIGKDHMNMYGAVHGGVFAALADGAMGVAICTLNKCAVTTDVHMQYLKGAAKGDVLIAKAIVEKAGGHMAYCSCRIFNQREELLAIGQGTFYIVNHDFEGTYIEKLREEGRY